MSTNVSEIELAKRLGVSRENLKKMRRQILSPTEDWMFGEGSTAVQITPEGQKKIRGALGLPEEPEQPESLQDEQPEPLVAGEKNTAAAAQDGATGSGEQKTNGRYTTLTVVAPARGNRCIVLCELAPGVPVRMRVRDNANFLQGMLVTTAVHEDADRYSYEGRLPRRRGAF